MVRTAVWVLRQRRYARLAVLMVFIAAGCVAAGTWQISRYERTGRINRALTANAHAAAVSFATLRVPLAGDGPAPGREAIRYRTVSVSGTYTPGAQEYVGGQNLNGSSGFYVVDPLRVNGSALLVVRGFVPADGDSTTPPAVAAAPAGLQRVVGRLQTPDTSSDGAAELGHGEIDSVNPGEQAARLGAPVFNAYLTLTGRQAGTTGLSLLPGPDLSNPAGGAVEPQHLAYIIQWYLFALLALAAPFAVARSEVRDARRTFLGIDPDSADFGAKPAAAQLASDPADRSIGGEVAVRERAELMRREAVAAQRMERAERLASRYGRSLSTGRAWAPDPALFADEDAGPATRAPDYVVANSADRPHRSPDAYHGLYNDYLWELAMADGAVPRVAVPAEEPTTRPMLEPTIIQADGRAVITSVEPIEHVPPAETRPPSRPEEKHDE